MLNDREEAIYKVSLVVAIGIKIVGTLLVGCLVAVPAAAAKNFSSDLLRYSILSALFGVISSTSGILISNYLNLPAGPLVVLAGITIFLVAFLTRWKVKTNI